uniref:Choloylglycine hydrolase/NAAA C-terminal domain-containing protein n=1 Tax=Meloidogyne javanica TaxID=6303 RepID=A0A915N8D6_MELJA
MAEQLRDTEVTLGELVVFNILYDLTDFSHGPFLKNNKSLSLGCTSIVAAQNNGKILHGRNLDYEMTQVLKDATILVDFVKNGKIQYTAVTFVLAVGIITGQKPNGFTVSLNARYSGGPILNILMELITQFEQDYVSALSQLSWTYMIAPSYLIVGGKDGDGAVITRQISLDRLGAVDVFTLDYRHYRWFLLETNFDHWKKSGDNRRKYGRKFMKQVGEENLIAKLMFEKVLSKWPIKNGLTISSTVMSAEEPNLIYNWTVVWGN